MRRTAFIDYESRDGPKRINRDQRRVNPISVGVICGDVADTVLELEVRANGQWSLVERGYGARTGTVVASGQLDVMED